MGNARNSLTEAVELFDNLDYEERMDLLIDYSESFKEIDSSIAQYPFDESNKVQKCESEVYVWILPSGEGRYELNFAVMNPQGVSAKAFAAILQQHFKNFTLDEVSNIPENMLDRLFGKTLSMGKAIGLQGMIELIIFKTGLLAGKIR